MAPTHGSSWTDRRCSRLLQIVQSAMMNTRQRVAFDREIGLARDLVAAGDMHRAFLHLERAHVIGQTFVGAHAMAHWRMLVLEIRRKRVGAVLGQAARLALGVIGSAVGIVPIGNTGGTDISMFKRLPIAPELQAIIDDSAAGPMES